MSQNFAASGRRIVIIGGGAAGLTAAVTAAQAGSTVTLFEANSAVGKKILASGNGRCNITNTLLQISDYEGSDPAFVGFALEQFGYARFKKFCASMGLLLRESEDGRCYPRSNTALSVVTALREYALHCGVTIVCDHFIDRAEKTAEGFMLHSGAEPLGPFDALLLATGSEAAPQLGANASGYAIAEAFGHPLLSTYPALVALELAPGCHHRMAGTKLDAEATLYIDGRAETSVRGDVLFTRYGVSGFAILDLSRKASQALLMGSRVTVGLKLLPEYERQSLAEAISRLAQTLPDYCLSTLLGGLLPQKVIPHLLESAGIAPELPASELPTKQAKKLANTICDWRFEVTGTHGFKHAEVSGGGVATEEIDPKTMASKRVEGLYLAGEILDVVGRRGGFNLHFAWASGYLAGTSMSRA